MGWKENGLALLLALTMLSPALMSFASNDQSARESVERVASLFSSKSSIATLVMQITDDDGQRSLSMKIWSLGDKTIIRINGPKEDAGTAILKIGSHIWYYLPKSKRTAEVPASVAMTSWMGSDFSIDDILKESLLVRDYSISTSFEGQRGGVAVHEYTLTPKPEAAVVWGKIVLQIRQADSVPTWQGYYDEDGKLVRELTFSDYKTMGGRLIPTHLTMHRVDKPGRQTTIIYKDVAFDVPISADMFVLPK